MLRVENANPPAPVNEVFNAEAEVQENDNAQRQEIRGILPNDMFFGFSDSDAHTIARFTRNELFIPLRLSFLMIAAFWSISIHGSLPLFMVGASLIFIRSITSIRDIVGSAPRRSRFHMLEMRLIQLCMMYCQLLCIHLLSWLTLPFKYFQNFGKLRQEIIGFFSGTGLHGNAHWTTYITISNQIFWLTFTWIVAARIISNLFMMSRTPSFRSLLRYETEAVMSSIASIWIGIIAFNRAADGMSRSTPMAMTLLLSLLGWVVICHVRSTWLKQELVIPRRNDLSGLLRVMTVIMSQLLVGALLHSLLSLVTSVTAESLSIQTSPSIPEISIPNYLHAVQTQTFKPGMQNVIELNKDLLMMIVSHVLMARLLKHRCDINKLDSILDRGLDI